MEAGIQALNRTCVDSAESAVYWQWWIGHAVKWEVSQVWNDAPGTSGQSKSQPTGWLFWEGVWKVVAWIACCLYKEQMKFCFVSFVSSDGYKIMPPCDELMAGLWSLCELFSSRYFRADAGRCACGCAHFPCSRAARTGFRWRPSKNSPILYIIWDRNPILCCFLFSIIPHDFCKFRSIALFYTYFVNIWEKIVVKMGKQSQ